MQPLPAVAPGQQRGLQCPAPSSKGYDRAALSLDRAGTRRAASWPCPFLPTPPHPPLLNPMCCTCTALPVQALRLPNPAPAVASLYTQKEFEAKRAYNVDKLQVKT